MTHDRLFFQTQRSRQRQQLLLCFSLQQNQRRRRWRNVIIFFFFTTLPYKKMTAHCHRLLFFPQTQWRMRRHLVGIAFFGAIKRWRIAIVFFFLNTKKKVTLATNVAFFVVTKLEKNTTTQYSRLLFFKCKEEGDGSSWHWLLILYNITIEEDDLVLLSSSSSF